jgi:hypothetical protein
MNGKLQGRCEEGIRAIRLEVLSECHQILQVRTSVKESVVFSLVTF